MRHCKSILVGISLLLTALIFIVEYDFQLPNEENRDLCDLQWDIEERAESGEEQNSVNPFNLLGGTFWVAPIGERSSRKLQLGSNKVQTLSIQIRPCSLPILYCSLKLNFC